MKLIVYRWEDGSAVSLESFTSSGPAGSGEYFKFVVRICQDGRMSRAGVNLMIVPPKSILLSEYSRPVIERIDGPFRAKLLGFMLSLNVGRPRPWSSGLIGSGSTRTHLKYPKFIDDQRFSSRYEEAANFTRTEGNFLGCVEGFRKRNVPYVSVKLIQLTWHYDDLPPRDGARIFRAETKYLPLREAVDQLIEKDDIRPESERMEWTAKNVEFGTWIMPSTGEIEVFQILDEPLPFFWEARRLEEWIDSVS